MSSEAPKKMKYSREFLISIGDSEGCKHLPPGVDLSLLNELQEASSVAYERSSKGPLGRNDGPGGYSYSSRGGGSGGRWDTRSTGSSDREGDLPDRDLLAQDRRNGNQYKRTWQNTEHDGLLGSGGFPRPSGYAGQLAPKDRGNVPQPNRTSERYQPPRPFKAGPPSRKDVDSMNDETFGSLECSNDDRAAQEKKRRASFELMRKEQHKSLQGNKNGPDTGRGNPGGDIMSMLQNSTDNLGPTTNSAKPDAYAASSSVYQEDTTKTPSILPAPAPRPLVPPGFSNAFVEKKVQSQSSNIALEPKVHVADREDKMPSIAQLGRNQSATGTTPSNRNEKGICDNIGAHQKYALPSGGVGSSTEFASNILKGTEEWEADAVDKYSIEKQSMYKNSGSVSKDNSISILEEFFGNTLSKSGGNLPTYIESQELKTDGDMTVSSVPESSKFARWFRDEDSKPSEDIASKSLLSMIVKKEAPGSQKTAPSGPSSSEKMPPKLVPFASAGGMREQYSHAAGIPEAAPAMMTCEDLEQAMLAQVAGNGSSTQKNAAQRHHQAVSEEPARRQKAAAVDSHASHHLLSLLQKGGPSPFGFHVGSADEPPQSCDVNGNKTETAPVNQAEPVPAAAAAAAASGGKSVTLEALFGAAFMSELHSKDAHPVSSIRGPHQGYNNYPGGDGGAAVEEAGGIAGMDYRNSSLTGPSHQGDRKGSELHLPEEDGLFSSGSAEMQNQERAVDDLSYKLQSLVSDDAQDGHPQNLYHLVQGGRPPALAPPPPRPMLDHHVGNRSQQARRSFAAANMQHSLNAPGVGPPAHHPMLERMPGSFPAEALPRGALPGGHQVAGYRPEMNNVNNLHMHSARQPPYYGGDLGGLMPPGPAVRGNHPESFERLMQMELTARSKQMHPAMAGPAVPGGGGMYGPELDMNSRYR